MGNEIVERAAKAMVEKCAGTPWEQLTEYDRDIMRNAARAAIAALREPSDAMLRSVDNEASDKFVARGRAYSAWTSMIDTALTEGNE